MFQGPGGAEWYAAGAVAARLVALYGLWDLVELFLRQLVVGAR